MKDTLAIVILNFNGQIFLEQFLPSVLAHSGDHRIIVADNASTDNSVSWLSGQYPAVEVIQLPQNTGYAGGYNNALRQIKAKYFCLLNSDVEVTPNWTIPLVSFLENNPEAAALQPKILDFNKKNRFEYGGGVGGYWDSLGYPFTRGRMLSTCEEDTGQYDTPMQVGWACGSCMVVRAEVFHALGGFDAAYFAHQEEIDLSWRMMLAGHEIWATGQSTVYHVGGGTLQYNSPRKVFLNFRNGLATLFKNTPLATLWWKFPARLFVDGLAGLQMLVMGSPRGCFAVVKAHFNFYWNFHFWLGKRRAIEHFRQKNNKVISFEGSLLWRYFVKNEETFSALWKK